MIRMNLIFLATMTILVMLTTSTSALIQGKDAARGQFPYYVYLRVQTSSKSRVVNCGGTLISNQWILTAARCLDDGEYAEVQLGFLTNDRNEVGKQIFNVTGHDFYVHFSEDGVL